MAKWLITAGALLLAAGLLLHFFPGIFKWFGRLPGDIRFESENSKVFIPITSMLIISAIISIVLQIIKSIR